MATHTFEFFGPSDSTIQGEAGGTVTCGAPQVKQRKLVDYTGSLQDLEISMAMRGFVGVGSGNQLLATPTFTQNYSDTALTVAALASWSAPGISGSYSAGITLLTGASADDLNDLADKCAVLEAEIAAHRNELTTMKGLINSLIDLAQNYGMAQ